MAVRLRASLITTESDRDLIVGFGLEPGCVDSLIIMRTPEFEQLLDEHERGANITHTGQRSWEGSLLVAVEWSGDTVRLKATDRSYCVDVSGVGEEDIVEVRRILELMNFDGRFSLTMDHLSGSGSPGD